MRLSTRRRNLAIMKYIYLGHSQKETGEKFGISRGAVAQVCRLFMWEWGGDPVSVTSTSEEFDNFISRLDSEIENTTYMDGKCKRCGVHLPENKNEYCIECSNSLRAFQRRSKYSELTESQKLKSACRSITRYLIRKGKIKVTLCVKCGSGIRVEAHHHDYTKPHDVVFLCMKCHREKHIVSRGDACNIK